MTVSTYNRALQWALRGKLPGGNKGGARLVKGLETLLHTSRAPDALYIGRSLRGHTFGLSLPIRHHDDLHHLTVASSGEGKGRTLWHPNGLTYPGSMVAFDINGEAVRIQITARERLGQRVVSLDPFGKSDIGCESSYNPLDEIQDSVTPADDCRSLAEAMLPPSSDNDPYWNLKAKRVVAGFMAYCVLEIEGATICHILDIFQMGEAEFGEHVDKMAAYDEDTSDLHRLAKSAATSMLEAEDQARHAIRESALNELAIFDSDQMRAVMVSGPVLFSELKSTPTTVYVVLPEDRVASHGRWLRLITTAALAALSRDRTVPQYRTLLVLDEFPNLGRLDALSKAISFLRGQNVKLWLICQDIGQLQALYSHEIFNSIVGNCGAITVLGSGDPATAKWVSDMSGVAYAKPTKRTPRPQGRPLFTPDQAKRFCSRQRGCGLLFVRGCNPLPFVRRGYDQIFVAGRDYDPLPQYARSAKV